MGQEREWVKDRKRKWREDRREREERGKERGGARKCGMDEQRGNVFKLAHTICQ